MSADPIGPTLSARAARARRACERWTETNDAKGAPLEVIGERATTSANTLGRDLTVAEVSSVCAAAVSAHVAAEEQRLAAEALSDARAECEAVEQEQRARYSAACAAAWRAGLPTPDPPRSQPVFALDGAGRREAAAALERSPRRREEPR